MIHPISFRGTYCISGLSPKLTEKVLHKSDKYEMQIDTLNYRDKIRETHITVPDYNDKKIEKLLNRYSVPYYFFNASSQVNKDEIYSRIKIDDSDREFGLELTDIDTDKLDKELRTNSKHYVGYGAKGGSSEKYERFKRFLHTKHDIQAITVRLEQKNDGTITTEIQDGRHRFAVLRDIGMKKIPVAMTAQSIKLAKEKGLI